MNLRTLSAHVLRALAESQAEGRPSSLETLTERLQVRRTDIRAALTALHREGHVDVLRMRLTFTGFAIGTALLGQDLEALRPAAAPAPRAVAA